MDKNIENYLKDPNIKGIMNAVSSRFNKSIDADDLSSISNVTLWRCINKYDSTKGAKFTSYLYQQLLYAFKNELKKKRVEFSSDKIEMQIDFSTKNEVFDIMESLPHKMKNVLRQRYFDNMTINEIAKANGYSRETARRRLNKAIATCRKITK